MYELITRHFIATLSPSATWLRTTVHVDIGGEEFTVGGRSDVKLGWLAVVTYVPFGLCIRVLVAVSCCARYGGGKSELHLPAMEEGEDDGEGEGEGTQDEAGKSDDVALSEAPVLTSAMIDKWHSAAVESHS